jgi:uncharacterized flavoprotein (TIGR03862 family)
MAANQIATATAIGARVTVFERRPGIGRKLLIAGSSGLNISHDAPLEEFLEFYSDRARSHKRECDPRLMNALRSYPAEKWVGFVAGLGHEVFVGSSRRWFVREMKASQLLASWTAHLRGLGTEFKPSTEIATRDALEDLRSRFDAVILALGGASWEETLPVWPALLTEYGVEVAPFSPSNVGYEVDFPEGLIQEAEGKPIKNCTLTTRLGSKQGELMLTRYGLEGTPMYFVGTEGSATLNLKPGVPPSDWLKMVSKPLKENLSPIRRLKRLGGLSEAAQAIVFHLYGRLQSQLPLKSLPADGNLSHRKVEELGRLARFVQAVPLTLLRPRPLAEAISSKGGVLWSELDDTLMLRKIPGVYCAGEMIDWDAPTGGFLIQASVALGARAAECALASLRV